MFSPKIPPTPLEISCTTSGLRKVEVDLEITRSHNPALYGWPSAVLQYEFTIKMCTESYGILRVCWHQTSLQKEKALFLTFHVRVGCKLHHVKKKRTKNKWISQIMPRIITMLELLSPTPPPPPGLRLYNL